MTEVNGSLRPQGASVPGSEGGKTAFVPVEGQSFSSKQDWINRATRALTRHPDYNNTEHGEAKGYRGSHFTALAFDQAGRRCRSGADMGRAEIEGAYPVWWIWPDQIVAALGASASQTQAGYEPKANEPNNPSNKEDR